MSQSEFGVLKPKLLNVLTLLSFVCIFEQILDKASSD